MLFFRGLMFSVRFTALGELILLPKYWGVFIRQILSQEIQEFPQSCPLLQLFAFALKENTSVTIIKNLSITKLSLVKPTASIKSNHPFKKIWPSILDQQHF
jgi:hypothetical protein